MFCRLSDSFCNLRGYKGHLAGQGHGGNLAWPSQWSLINPAHQFPYVDIFLKHTVFWNSSIYALLIICKVQRDCRGLSIQVTINQRATVLLANKTELIVNTRLLNYSERRAVRQEALPLCDKFFLFPAETMNWRIHWRSKWYWKKKN